MKVGQKKEAGAEVYSGLYPASQVALVVKNLPASVGDRRHGFDTWVRKILWKRKWQPTTVSPSPIILVWRIPWAEKPGEL